MSVFSWTTLYIFYHWKRICCNCIVFTQRYLCTSIKDSASSSASSSNSRCLLDATVKRLRLSSKCGFNIVTVSPNSLCPYATFWCISLEEQTAWIKSTRTQSPGRTGPSLPRAQSVGRSSTCNMAGLRQVVSLFVLRLRCKEFNLKKQTLSGGSRLTGRLARPQANGIRDSTLQGSPSGDWLRRSVQSEWAATNGPAQLPVSVCAVQ